MINIKVIGKESSNRTKLLKNLSKVKNEIDEKFSVEIIDNINLFNEYNITNFPSLIINDKVVSEGKILTDREIKRFIKVLNT